MSDDASPTRKGDRGKSPRPPAPEPSPPIEAPAAPDAHAPRADAHPAPDGHAAPQRGRRASGLIEATIRETDPEGLLDGGEPGFTPEEEGQIRSGKLAGKTLGAAIAILAIPVLMEQLASALVGFVDQSLASRLVEGVPALDAIGIGSYVDWFIAIAMTTVGVGGAALISRAIGAGDRRLADDTLRTAVQFGFLWGIVVGVGLWLAAPLLASIANLSPEAAAYCVAYIRIQAYGLPVMAVLLITIACLHGAGETTWPFLVMLVVNLVNILASWTLSGVDFAWLANPFDYDLGVEGIATGTVVAKLVGAVLILLLARRGVKGLKLEGRLLVPQLDVLKRITRIGVPAFLDGAGMWIGNFLVLAIIGSIAVTSGQREGLIGAHIIAIRWESFSFLPGYAIGIAAGALAGQFLGAGNEKRAARAILLCTGLGATFMGLAGILFIVEGEALTRLISPKPGIHQTLTPQLLFYAGWVQVFFAAAMVIRNGLRGAGDTMWVWGITWTSTYLIRLPAAYVIGIVLDGGLVGVWIAASGELVIRGILFFCRFWHGGWKNVKI